MGSDECPGLALVVFLLHLMIISDILFVPLNHHHRQLCLRYHLRHLEYSTSRPQDLPNTHQYRRLRLNPAKRLQVLPKVFKNKLVIIKTDGADLRADGNVRNVDHRPVRVADSGCDLRVDEVVLTDRFARDELDFGDVLTDKRHVRERWGLALSEFEVFVLVI